MIDTSKDSYKNEHNKSRIDPAKRKLDEMHAAGIKLKHLDPIEKAKKNPNSLRSAINAMCYDCQGKDADPCVEWRIGNCQIVACTLFPHRPYQHLEGSPTPKALALQNGEEAPK